MAIKIKRIKKLPKSNKLIFVKAIVYPGGHVYINGKNVGSYGQGLKIYRKIKIKV